MITIFNRKELITCYDEMVQIRVREALIANRIDYVINGRPIMGGYRIWVKKEDYDLACYAIRDVFRFPYSVR